MPAFIETQNEEKFLSIDKKSLVLNNAVLSRLELKNTKRTKDQFIQDITHFIQQADEDFIRLKSILEKYFVNVELEDVPLYPTVWKATQIRKYLSEHEFEENNFKLIPAAGTIFIEKSESSLRVLNDLSEIAKKNVFNTSLQSLLGDSKDIVGTEKDTIYQTRLNVEQSNALQNSNIYTNSIIVGPPGTGKSYTITSIVADAILNDKTVLVVSKTKQAVEVLRSILEDDFNLKKHLVQTTGRNYKKSLTYRVKKFLGGILDYSQSTYASEHEINSIYKEIIKCEKEFEGLVNHEIKKSNYAFKDSLSLLEKWKKYYLNLFNYEDERLWEIFNRLEDHLILLDKKIKKYTRNILHSNQRVNLDIYRKDYSTFLDALEANSFTEYKEYLSRVNQKNVLKAFPIWLANLSELNAVLPLQKDLFDLVIIDEATQCDIASALPAIYRAKQSIIVGDPNQLKHYSFVSQKQQDKLRKKYELPSDKLFDYRNRSILDLYLSKVKSNKQVTFLREHFRSTPSLIEFSNVEFYDGQLNVLKSTPKHTQISQLELIQVNGVRTEKGINVEEGNSIIHQIKSIIKESNNLTLKPSIGVISPFSKQVVYLNKLLKETFALETLREFKILCGSPYQFQGSEREIVLISFVVCDHSHHSAFIHLNKPEVLNVAITRAKSRQYIFNSLSDKTQKEGSLIHKYLQFAKSFEYKRKDEESVDLFQKEVFDALDKHYDFVETSYHLGNNLLDVLVMHNGKSYFIDLIGYPGRFKQAFSMERYKTLARTGIKSFPLHYSFWKNDKPKAIKMIQKFIR